MTATGDYDWLSADASVGLGESACLTVVVGKLLGLVSRDFGLDDTHRVPIGDVFAGYPALTASLLEGAGGTVAIEINGFQGSRPEVLRPASKGGKAASVLWNVNGRVSFACAQKGRMVCDFDLLLDEVPDELPASLKRLLPDDRLDANTGLEALGASMVEAFTGVQVTRQMIAAMDHAFVLHPSIAPLEIETPEFGTLSFDNPQLVEQLVAAGDVACRRIAQWAALQSVEHAGLADDSRVRSVTAQFGNGAPAVETGELIDLTLRFDRDADRAELVDDAREPDEWGETVGPSQARQQCWQRQWVAAALRHNCLEDPLSAALGAVGSAKTYFAIGNLEASFVDELSRAFRI